MYRSFWVWASAAGFLRPQGVQRPDRRTVGRNLGGGCGDTAAATENSLIRNGCSHKLGQVDFTYEAHDRKQPWRMVAPDGRLELEFGPWRDLTDPAGNGLKLPSWAP